MRCFSIIASNIPGKLIGSCPKATFNLYKSEDVNSEYPIEEQNWVSAAERADSIGVDILSTSLGYTTFDNPIFNHTYQDMNGKTTIIARANVLAAKKGIISVVAAGNEGNSTWHFISSPADADHVLTVGAVSTSGQPASFSSYGPTSDGRVKPDVASVGVATATSSPSGAVVFGNGTSFATPNIAGLTTCLWQAFQDFTNLEIIDAIKKSSSIYNLPDDRIGYGIPNFHIAYDILTLIRSQRNMPDLNKDWIRVYPNPFPGNFYVAFKPKKTGNAFITVYDESGKMYDSKNIATIEGQSQNIFFNIINATAKSIYYVEYNDGTNKRSIRIMRR